MYSTGTAPPLLRPEIAAEILAAFFRYWSSLIEKYARIGLTLETVVIFVVGPTRSPTWDVATPDTPSMGEYTFVHSRLSLACSAAAFAASSCAFPASTAAL